MTAQVRISIIQILPFTCSINAGPSVTGFRNRVNGCDRSEPTRKPTHVTKSGKYYIDKTTFSLAEFTVFCRYLVDCHPNPAYSK